jgi:hypothetical protein
MTKPRYFAVGVRRRPHSRTLYCDIDSDNLDVYRTQHGFHIVSRLAHAFDYKFKRLRVGSKINGRGEVANPEPRLVFCACPGGNHSEKRLDGRLEIYCTNSR